MNSMAIVGNGNVPNDSGTKIDAFDEVVRINRAIWREHMEIYASTIGRKTTIYAHNCWCETEPCFWLPKNTKIWLTLPIDNYEFVCDVQHHKTIFKNAGFDNVYQFTVDDIKPLHELYELELPTTGIRTIWHAICIGYRPVLFGFSQDLDMHHYFDKETLSSNSLHNMNKERIALSKIIDAGLAELGQ